MRMSLLLEREPFGQILEDTLAGYWRKRHGKDFAVRWFPENPGDRDIRRLGLEAWAGNFYTNAFARTGTPSACFEVLQHEYSRSLTWWKRPAQRMYVRAATHPWSMHRLAQIAFGVAPEAPEAAGTLILGGNHRLRILHPATKTTTVVLKAGFPKRFIENEIQARRHWPLECTPKLQTVAPDESWFVEEYVVGTPLNRLAENERAYVAQALDQLREQLVAPNLRYEPAAARAANLLEAVRSQAKSALRPSPSVLHEFESLLERLEPRIERLCGPELMVPVSLTHGDFQPANLLADGNGVWLIDWESTASRFAAYDLFTYALKTRKGSGWSQRIVPLLNEQIEWVNPYLENWPGLDWTASRRADWVLLHVLEEALFVLEDSGGLGTTTVDQSLLTFFREFSRAINILSGKAP